MPQYHTDINRPWVERHIPKVARPYALLMRLDRPVGNWLLLWPCWWSMLLATEVLSFSLLWWGTLFAVGAVVMRGAGCVINDLADQDFDAQVTRTSGRPLPSGQVSRRQAMAFGVLLSLIGLAVLLQFNKIAIMLGLAAIVPVVIYPFMKRVTDWPQIVLGIAFNWGGLLGWVVVRGQLDWPAVALYFGGLFWTVGYDTIYAHQDREDDIMVGIKSTALVLGNKTRSWVGGFYGIAAGLWIWAGYGAEANWPYFVAIVIMSGHFIWQVLALDIDDPVVCLHLFKSNIWAGSIIFFGCLLNLLI